MAALRDIRVLDFSRVLSGPFCTSLMADLGADVVKVEPPTGDDSRHLGPFAHGESAYFAMLNRGKRSIALDLKDATDRQTCLELVDQADVVVENFRPGVAERLGIGPDSVRARNPRLVYASISGFGQSGPLSGLPAYDLIIQAMSGLMASTGDPDGEPTKVGESIADLLAGLYASWAVCAALVERHRTGDGAHLDVAMLDALVSMQPTNASLLAANGTPPGRVGNRHPVSTPFGVYHASDGPVVLAAANERIFQNLLVLIERPDLVSHPHFCSDETRTANEPEVRATIEEWTGTRTVADVLAGAGEHGVPAGPVQDLAAAVDSVRERDVLGQLHDQALGKMTYLRQPVRFHDTAPRPEVQPEPEAEAKTEARVSGLGHDHDAVLRDWLPSGRPAGGYRQAGPSSSGP